MTREAALAAWTPRVTPVSTEKPRIARAAWLALAELQDFLDRPGAALMRWIPRSALEDRYLRQLLEAGYVRQVGDDHVQTTSEGKAALRAHDLVGPIGSIRERLEYPAGHGVRVYRTAWLNDPVRRR